MSGAAQAAPPLPPLSYPAIAELARLRQWVLWRLLERDGKPTKVPFSSTGGLASVTDPSTWSTFNEVCQKLTNDPSYSGIGFVFTDTDPFCGIDLDHCLNPESGELNSYVKSILSSLDSYTEITPSGNGLHVIVRVTPGLRIGKRRTSQGIEVYSSERYFTVTGNHFETCKESIEERETQVNELLEKFGLVEKGGAKHAPAGESSDISVLTDKIAHFLEAGAEPDRTLFDALLANAPEIGRVWHREAKGKDKEKWSASEWDMSLCSHLVHARWPLEEIVKTLIAFRRLHNVPGKLRADYYARTYLRACRENEINELDEQLTESTPEKMNGEAAPKILELLTEIYSVPFTGIIKYTSEPAQYRVATSKGYFKGDIDVILSQAAFARSFADATGVVIEQVSRKKWNERSQAMLNAVSFEELSEDTTDAGQANVWLRQYLDDNGAPAAAKTPDVVRAGSPFWYEGHLYVNGSALADWLKTQKRTNLNPTALAVKLREAGAASRNMSARHKGSVVSKSYWKVPEKIAAPRGATQDSDDD